MLYLNSGLLAGCRSAGGRWQQADGTQIRLIWAACDQQEMNLLSGTYAAKRTRIPAAWRGLSVLGPDSIWCELTPTARSGGSGYRGISA